MIKETNAKLQLLLFSIGASLLTYCFNLTNFSLSIDSEPIVTADSYLFLGRWGTNFIRYYIFNGAVIPYFTILLSLLFLSIAAFLMAGLFRLSLSGSYLFCALFVSFPQMAYQFIFYIQADAIALGMLLSVLTVWLFIKLLEHTNKLVSIGLFILAALIMMFAIAIYQALILVPAVIYLIVIFRNTHSEEYTFSKEFKKVLFFGLLLFVSGVLYYISQKLLCPEIGDEGYLASYAKGGSGNQFVNFYNIWVDNLRGDKYYGDNTFFVASLSAAAILILLFLKERNMFLVRALLLFLMLITPFLISFFITNGYHPPRLYLASGIVYAYLIAYFISSVRYRQLGVGFASVVILANIYYVTRLYVSQHALLNHDIAVGRKIDDKIRDVYPDFEPRRDYVYFYGAIADTDLGKMRLPNSDVFSASFFQWDTGSNGRIIPFLRATNVADYKMIDDKALYLKIKDSLSDMPVWPRPGSVKHVDEVMVVKLGNVKGANLPVE